MANTLAMRWYSWRVTDCIMTSRANIWALQDIGVKNIISVAAVGGITEETAEVNIVIPDQIIDYTWSREHTFYNGDEYGVEHIDFTEPYSAGLRDALIDAAEQAGIPVCPFGTYGATQGPRLETAAEILRMERDGCTVVGMTGMPEAALARELALNYASLNVIANRAAGKGEGEITLQEIHDNLTRGMAECLRILEKVIPIL
jgi:purine nucleoside phosphorylase